MTEMTRVETEPRHGSLVRTKREALGLSQQALASKANLAMRTVARIESGEDTTLGTLTAIATALGVPVADLVAAPETGDAA